MTTYRITAPNGKTYQIEGPPGASDAEVARAVMAQFPESAQRAVETPKPADDGFLRQAVDVPVGVARGAAMGVRMVADAFGANNPVSNTIKSVEGYLGGLLSAQAKQDEQEVARIMKDAEDKGVLEQVKAGFKAFATAPIDLLSQGLGTAAPAIVGGLGATLLRAGVTGARAVGAGIGAGMGSGAVKGQIYEGVKEALSGTDMSPEQVEARAQLAQSYGGENLDMILTGAALGGLASVTGIEPILARQAAKNIVGRSIVGRAATTGAAEAVPEIAQGSQEQLAQNIALQREGFDVDTMRGVVGAGTLEGLAGAGLGAVVGATQSPTPPAGTETRTADELPPAPPEGTLIPEGPAPDAPETDLFGNPVSREEPPAPREMTFQQAIAARVPTMQMPLMFEREAEAAVEEETVPGAITMEELQSIGKPMRTSKSWFEDNVVGKTPEQVQAMVDADPKLIEGKTARAQVLREILAPKPAEFVEAPNAQPAADVRPERTRKRPSTEPSVGTPVEPIEQSDAAGTQASDAVGVVPVDRPVGAAPSAEGTGAPALTTEDQAFDQLARAVQDESSPEYAEAGQILEANRNNPAFLAKYDAAVRRVNNYGPRVEPVTQTDAEPTVEEDVGPTESELPPQRSLFAMSPEEEVRLAAAQEAAARQRERDELEGKRAEAWAGVPDVKRTKAAQGKLPLEGKGPKVEVEGPGRGVATESLTTAVAAQDTRGALQEIASGEGFSPIDRLVANRLLRSKSLPKIAKSDSLDAPGQYFPKIDTAVLREVDSHTVLHETVHGFVHRLIAAENAGSVQSAGVRKLRAVMQYVAKANPALRNTYGYKNLSEFASEAMSNPEFQAELRKIPYQRTNAFTAFARAVLDMLGIKGTTENNALAESLISVESILDTGRAMEVAEAGTDADQMDDTPAAPEMRRTPAPSTPTATGQEAMGIVRALGMDPAPEPTAAQKLKASWDTARQNPKQVTQNAKQAMVTWRDKLETAVWSSDAGIQNAVRRTLVGNSGTSPEVMGTLLDISTSQAAGSEAFAGQFLSDGAAEYDADLHKWVTKDSPDNMVSISRSLDVVAEKYGLTKEQAEQVGHAAFVARRLDGIRKANDRLYARAAALRAAKKDKEANAVEAGVKFVHLDDAQIDEGLRLLRLMPELQTTINHWNGFRSNVLDVMVAGELYTRADAEALLDVMDYVPFYRDEQLENSAGPREYMRTLQVKGEKRMKGSTQPVHDVFDNMARWAQFAVSRSVKNRTGLALAETAVDAGFMEPFDSKAATSAERRAANVVRVWKDGEQIEFNALDPLYMDAFQGLQSVSIPAFKFFADLANVLRQSVVLNPLFSIAQVPQDSFAAMFTSGLSPRYALSIPARAVKEFVKTLAGTSRTHEQLRRFGVVGQRDVSAAVVRMDAEILAGLKAPSGFKAKLMSRLNHIAMASDNAVRQAVYEAAQAQGMGKAESIEKAYQIINFRNRGTSKLLAVAAQVIPFFNAYLAATHVMYKTVTGAGTSPQDRADGLKRLAAMSASVATLSLMYAMLMGDDEDYEDTRPQLRDRLLMIPGTGVGIPLRPDVFLLPKVLGESLYHAITDDGLTDGPRFRKSVQELLVNTVLSPTAVPQAVKPLVEVGINYSFFTGRPLVGIYEQQREKSRQYTEYTSELGKALGSTNVVSPIAVDHVIRGMLGSLGGSILYTTNFLLHSDPEVERPSMNMRDAIASVPGMSAIVTKSAENGLRNDFYELREATRRADSTFKDLEKRSPHLIEGFLADKNNMARVALAEDVEAIAKELTTIRKDIADISNAPASLMSAGEKQSAIDELRDIEKQLLKAVPIRELRKAANL